MSPRRPPRAMTQQVRQAFLAALADGWSIEKAAGIAGRDRRRFYELRESDEAFAAAWDEALERGTQLLEDELRRRAVEGWDEETYDGEGNLIRRVNRVSPNDLHLLVKARRPDVYRENSRLEVSGEIGPNKAVMDGLERFLAGVERHVTRSREMDERRDRLELERGEDA